MKYWSSEKIANNFKFNFKDYVRWDCWILQSEGYEILVGSMAIW